MLEVSVEDKDVVMKDNFMGWVLYDLCVVPKRLASDSAIPPKWYRLEDRKGDKLNGELMLAVWWGTRADEAFPETDHHSVVVANDAASVGRIKNQSKVYMLPRLWYVRVNVIEGKELMMPSTDGTRSPEIFVKATLGNQIVQTRICLGPFWNEELMFVAAEPFEEYLILSVEDRVEHNKDEVLGMCAIPLQYVNRRFDNRTIESRWFNLQRDFIVEGKKTKQTRFAGRIHMSLCLEGGYHVQHESDQYRSDFRPSAKRLWKKSIGVLELGILSAHGLSPAKDGRATTNAYCVAKYGTKWVRTRTVVDSFTPRWNEQYTFEVFDPCTVLTIGVFDNNFRLQGGDTRIGKVRIRVSTLETDRIYAHLYPLFVVYPSGLKKMGEIKLAVRLTCSFSFPNLMRMYCQPRLPEMHYIRPLTVTQFDSLRHHAIQTVSMRLSRAEPPLRIEVVEYMLDVGCDMWSMRRSKANFFRIMRVVSDSNPIRKLLTEIYNWKNLKKSGIIHIIFFILVMYPEHTLPFIFLFICLLVAWSYRWRPRHPPRMDTRLSCADTAHPDELDEEFDTYPTSRITDAVGRMRYDRLRSVSVKLQNLAGKIATQGEKIESLLIWRDPKATQLFVIFCLVAAIVLYAIPFYAVATQTVLYVSKHLRFKSKLPSVPANFFSRLPTRSDSLL